MDRCKFKVLPIWVVCVLFYFNSALGQVDEYDKQSLELEKNELLEQINEAKEQLNKIKSSKKSSLTEIALIQKKINLRLKAIDLMNKQITEIDKSIRKHKEEIDMQSKYIETLKKQYKNSIISAYKINQVYDPTYFLLSSKSFSDFIDKLRFLKKFRSLRTTQLNNIKRTTKSLKEEINQLSASHVSQKKILIEKKDELSSLNQEKDDKKNVIKKLKEDEKKIIQRIAQKTSQWKKIKKAIEKIIKSEIVKSKKKILEDQKKYVVKKKFKGGVEKTESNVEESALTYTDKDFNLSKNFKSNKGKLPWPVPTQTSVVTMQFGNNRVTEESNIKYDNSGLTFGVRPDIPVRCIFNGNVTNIQAMDEGFLITIRHGEYWSVYTPIFKVKVSTDQEIKTGDIIGYTSNSGQPELEFQILKETTFVNPELWLKK